MSDPQPPRHRPTRDSSLHSVRHEPAMFPGQAGAVIAGDFGCQTCGYNLRGLRVGQPCPECATIPLYAPLPIDASTVAALITSERRAQRAAVWVIVPGVLAASALGGVGGALASFAILGPLLLFAIGPALEEAFKIFILAWILEVRPLAFRSATGVMALALTGAALYAAVENLIVLGLTTAPSATAIAWRWTVCIVAHVGLTAVAGQCLVAMWRQAAQGFRRPQMGDHLLPLGVAIVLHGLYNATLYYWPWQEVLL